MTLQSHVMFFVAILSLFGGTYALLRLSLEDCDTHFYYLPSVGFIRRLLRQDFCDNADIVGMARAGMQSKH